MFTEQEAGTKWCPMVRDHDGRNLHASGDRSYCIGSKCMMWRWFDQEKQLKDPHRYTTSLQMILAPDSEKELTPNRRGYCGISNKPDVA